jgi:diketogulonate reductase-like aldo/keto reductase
MSLNRYTDNRVEFTFGTYKLKGDILTTMLTNIFKNTSIRSIDTAQLYKNETEIGQYLFKYLCKHNKHDEQILITTKIWETSSQNKTTDDIVHNIKNSVKKLNPNNNPNIHIRVLLHHATQPNAWKALETCHGMNIVQSIGVSNHNIEHLKSLLTYACIKPCVNQLEVHPFLNPEELQPLLTYCEKASIPVQAHSVLCKGKRFEQIPSITNFTKAQLLLAWAASHPIVKNICLTSTNYTHLKELLDTPHATPKQILNQEYNQEYIRLYPFAKVT